MADKKRVKDLKGYALKVAKGLAPYIYPPKHQMRGVRPFSYEQFKQDEAVLRNRHMWSK